MMCNNYIVKIKIINNSKIKFMKLTILNKKIYFLNLN